VGQRSPLLEKDRQQLTLQAAARSTFSAPIARTPRAAILARIYENFPLRCPQCVGAMRIIAFIADGPTVRDILVHLGEPRRAGSRLRPSCPTGEHVGGRVLPARRGRTPPNSDAQPPFLPVVGGSRRPVIP